MTMTFFVFLRTTDMKIALPVILMLVAVPDKNSREKEGLFGLLLWWESPSWPRRYSTRSKRHLVTLCLQSGSREVNANVVLGFCIVFSPGPRSIQWCCPLLEWIFPYYLTQGRSFLTDLFSGLSFPFCFIGRVCFPTHLYLCFSFPQSSLPSVLYLGDHYYVFQYTPCSFSLAVVPAIVNTVHQSNQGMIK